MSSTKSPLAFRRDTNRSHSGPGMVSVKVDHDCPTSFIGSYYSLARSAFALGLRIHPPGVASQSVDRDEPVIDYAIVLRERYQSERLPAGRYVSTSLTSTR